MRFLVILPVLALLAACGGSGHFDADGNYITSDYEQPAHDKLVPHYKDYSAPYTRAGYYDYEGNYVTVNKMAVPSNQLPPAGLCRVWIPNTPVDLEPPVESCDGIQNRVPVGAYVIYGG
jgi:hypothetical protein